MKTRRDGFTIAELLIVIGIILLLSVISLAVFNTGRSSDRIRSGSRVAQSAFLGAKDRAMHAKNFRGTRLMRDAGGPTWANGIPCLVNGFAYIQPIELQTFLNGAVRLERLDIDQNGSADSTDILVVRGIGSPSWYQWATTATPILQIPGQIRIPATSGQWYQFSFQIGGNGPYVMSANNQALILQTPCAFPSEFSYANNNANPNANDVIAVSANKSSCDIQLGNEVLPWHSPISLPSGVVIDLRYSSQNVQSLAGANLASGSTPPTIDVSFSPRGSIAGATGGIGSLIFCMRDLEDAMSLSTNPLTANGPRDPSDAGCKGDCLLLALNPATGLVQTYPPDLTDANADGFADNLFSFAQQGKAAGH